MWDEGVFIGFFAMLFGETGPAHRVLNGRPVTNQMACTRGLNRGPGWAWACLGIRLGLRHELGSLSLALVHVMCQVGTACNSAVLGCVELITIAGLMA